jgi:integrase
MASMAARHSRECETFGGATVGRETRAWPSDRKRQEAGCTCRPSYSARFGDGEYKRFGRVPIAEALKELRKLEGDLEKGTHERVEPMLFPRWSQLWLGSLERKETTVNSYRSTVAYAEKEWERKQVGQVTPKDVAALSALMKQETLSDSTRAKHLRVLSACFNSAIEHGHATSNPVKRLPRSEKPRARRKESAYFEAAELPLVFKHVPDGLYRTLFLVALKTGMRQGELFALTWSTVDLQGIEITVRRSITDGIVSTTKNHQVRTVDLAPDVVGLLGEWRGECGKPTDAELVFPRELGRGYLSSKDALAVLYGAMRDARVPREGPTGEKRTFHSFRHTFAKTALENGRDLFWLSRHLGHQSLAVTTEIYGHWSRESAKKQAALMAGAFTV